MTLLGVDMFASKPIYNNQCFALADLAKNNFTEAMREPKILPKRIWKVAVILFFK